MLAATRAASDVLLVVPEFSRGLLPGRSRPGFPC
jgi:hypothetical protein